MARSHPTRRCRCDTPQAEVTREHVAYCDTCGELLPEPTNATLLLEVRRLHDRLDNLPNSPQPKLLTAQELAERLGVSVRLIYKRADELEPVRIGTALRFDPEKAVAGLAPRPFRGSEDE